MKSISKKKGEEGEAKYPNALIMPLFKDKEVKKDIRASVSASEVIYVVSSARDTVNQALSALYVGAKRQEDQWGLSTASSHHVTRIAWSSARN
eukprot:680968-Ditylum_brightwellii.AAC.1